VRFLLTRGRMQGRASEAKADSLKPHLSPLLHPQQILQCWLPKELSSDTAQARSGSYLKRWVYLYTFYPPSLPFKLPPCFLRQEINSSPEHVKFDSGLPDNLYWALCLCWYFYSSINSFSHLTMLLPQQLWQASKECGRFAPSFYCFQVSKS